MSENNSANSGIFRKASLDRINSPDQLNEYIRAVSPGVWITLAAIIVLLAGVVIWGVFGTIESKVETGVVCEDGTAVGWFSVEGAEEVKVGMPVKIGSREGTVTKISDTVMADDPINPYALYLGGIRKGDFCRCAVIEIDGLPDGVYEGKIVVEKISPMSFVFK